MTLLITGLFATGPLTAQPKYIVADLGTFDGTFSSATGINNSGQVVGLSYITGNAHAFRTTANGAITPDSDLGVGPLGGTASVAYAINNWGQVAGTAVHAFRTVPNSPITADSDLGTLLPGTSSNATGINDLGQVVGYLDTQYYPAVHAFRTAPNGLITAASDLGTLGGTLSRAYGINNSGQVVGYFATTGNTAQHAFRTAANGPITPESDLGTLGGSSSSANAINNSGQVVGSFTTIGNVSRAFVYTGVMYDLNNLIPAGSGWELQAATGINDAGQIVGFGMQNGLRHAIRLDPAALVQICNVAGTGVAVGTNFNFNVAGTAVKVPAGAPPSGSCSAPFVLLAGSAVFSETLSSGIVLSGVSTLPSAALLVSSNLSGGTATVTVNAGVQTILTFINSSISTAIGPPFLSQTFDAGSIYINGRTTLSFAVTNANTGIALTGVGFTDSMPAGLVIATPNGLTTTCGAGTIIAMAGTGTLALEAAGLSAGTSCSVSVNVTATTAGLKNNTVTVFDTVAGTGNTARATLAVNGPPVLTQAFGAATIPLGGAPA